MIEVEPLSNDDSRDVDFSLNGLISYINNRYSRLERFLLLVWFLMIFVARYFEVIDLFIIFSSFGYIFTYGLGKREAGTMSAYSLFNPGFREIEGTLNINRIENEMVGRNNNGNEQNNQDIAGNNFVDNEFDEDQDIQEAIRRSLEDMEGKGAGTNGKSKKKLKEEKKLEREKQKIESLRKELSST